MEFRLPDLGEDTTGGDVIQVLVKEGDTVEKDQIVLELETDKALLEVPSPCAGRITKIQATAGSKIGVNDLIMTIEEREKVEIEESPAAQSPPAPELEPEPEPAAQSQSVSAPESKPQPAAETPTAPPPTPIEEVPAPSRPAAAAQAPSAASAPVAAAPSVRRLAREMGIDLTQIQGSGPGGRIGKQDLMDQVKARVSASSPTQPHQSRAADSLPDFNQWGTTERQPLTNVRKKIMESMTRSWATIPHVTQADEADITELLALRKRHAQSAAEKGGKLTVTVFVLKALIAALKAFPQFNATLDAGSQELVLKHYYHIGLAVDTDHGLLVPAIRDVDKKSLIDLSAEMALVAGRARERKLSLEDMRGGTFTITNLGGLGGTMFTPIIHYPEVAILGLARSQKRLVQTADGIATRTFLPLCLSYDHRVIDGADGVRFTRKIAQMLEDPALLVLES